MCYLTQVLLLLTQESNTEAQMLGKRKDNFIEGASNPGEEVDSCPKELTSHCQSGARVFKGVHRWELGRRVLHAEQYN